MRTAAVIAPKASTEKNDKTARIMTRTLRRAEPMHDIGAISTFAS
jgi:hypothetical protein